MHRLRKADIDAIASHWRRMGLPDGGNLISIAPELRPATRVIAKRAKICPGTGGAGARTEESVARGGGGSSRNIGIMTYADRCVIEKVPTARVCRGLKQAIWRKAGTGNLV